MSTSKNTYIRTDLAIEAKDMYVLEEEKESSIKGIRTKEKEELGVTVVHVSIDGSAEKAVGKKAGTYITLHTESVKEQDATRQIEASTVLSQELKRLLQTNNVTSDDVGLIVGLGNYNVTPDALGPMTIEHILVTNHLFMLEHEDVSEGYRPVGAISPGVMGTTGMETSDMIQGVIQTFQPDFIIAVDALASRSVERVNETIQITDTGIHPGSGVGNKRKELSKETLGIPVIAIGVPTVVDAVTITTDTIDLLLKYFGRKWKEKDDASNRLVPASMSFGMKKLDASDLPTEKEREAILGMVGTLSEEEKRMFVEEALTSSGKNFIVTPKEVDQYMNDMSLLIAQGLNAALHEAVPIENASTYSR
ncbi:MAG TPA: GPR endopeptidase [Bacillota bacterium]|nr:GPR endopeptidase [Bacillota bacterium]